MGSLFWEFFTRLLCGWAGVCRMAETVPLWMMVCCAMSFVFILLVVRMKRPCVKNLLLVKRGVCDEENIEDIPADIPPLWGSEILARDWSVPSSHAAMPRMNRKKIHDA